MAHIAKCSVGGDSYCVFVCDCYVAVVVVFVMVGGGLWRTRTRRTTSANLEVGGADRKVLPVGRDGQRGRLRLRLNVVAERECYTIILVY